MKDCESKDKRALQKEKDVRGSGDPAGGLRYSLSPGVDLCRRKVHEKRFGNASNDELSPSGWTFRPDPEEGEPFS